MIYISISEKRRRKSGITNPQRKVYILTEHIGKAPYPVVNLFRESHIERARRKFFHRSFTSSYASGRKERGHSIIDGLLQPGKRTMSRIGTAVTVDIGLFETTAHRLEIRRGNNTVRVEKNQITPLGTFHSIITGKAATRIFLIKITYRQTVGIFPCHLIATTRRPVLDKQQFEILTCLPDQTFEQLPYLIGSVIHGNND